MNRRQKKTISYIFPIYNEAGNLELLHTTLSGLLDSQPAYDFELVFVNDGSTDASLQKLLQLSQEDGRVVVINFSRNFGHQMAVTAGLDNASGDAVIIMDSDMQDPPEVSLDLIKKWEEGYEVVYAQRRSRKDKAFKRLTASVFYIALQKLAEINIPRDTGDFRLLDRKVVTALNSFREHSRFLRGLVSYVGFKQTAVLFDRHERYAGTSGYPLKKMLKFAADGILGFSTAPLKFIVRIGIFVSCLSVVGIVYALTLKIFYPNTLVPGWTFIVIGIFFIGGVQLLTLGVLGSYIGRIFMESQNRPLYIVESITAAKRNT